MLFGLNHEFRILPGLKLKNRFAGNTPCFRGVVPCSGGSVSRPFGNLLRVFQLITQTVEKNSLCHNNQKQSRKRENCGHSPSPTCSPQLFDLKLWVFSHARILFRQLAQQSFN